MFWALLLLTCFYLSFVQASRSGVYDQQLPLIIDDSGESPYSISDEILRAIEQHPDNPVEAWIQLEPELASWLGESRLLLVFAKMIRRQRHNG